MFETTEENNWNFGILSFYVGFAENSSLASYYDV